ncbi:MAG: hypothetical protein LBS22_02435 [Puniceicoccales bacterium]|jgi:hypothetical protein|nr:hypothetical protein [Puniceicoccales bacterium]
MSSLFHVPEEINLIFEKYVGEYVILPAGELLASGPRRSFLPKGGQTVYAYEIDDRGNVTGYYLNGQRVSFGTWRIVIAKEEGLRNSNFGQKPLRGMQNLTTRVASRFLEVEKPSALVEVKEPSSILGVEEPPVPLETEKLSALVEVKKPSSILGVEEPPVPPETEKLSALVEVKEPSSILGVAEPPVPPTKKVSTRTRTRGHRKARLVVRSTWLWP